ncbi:MAG: nucleoside deaminase [Fimbriimonadaceae bacterium]|nr:nucleoside deaminase [Chitinophagales bacterium]
MGLLTNPDEYFMNEALKLAQKAFDEDEVPIGAVIVIDNQIIAKAHNLVERLHDPTAHAEMQAITQACNYFSAKYLPDCTIYITLEPCTMCATAIFWAQIAKLIFGAYDDKLGFTKHKNILYPKTIYEGGVMESECSALIKNFFKGKR